MSSATMVTAGQAEEAAVVAPRMRILTFQGARLRDWKTVLIQSLGRELNALQRQQQERAFMATTHGLNYSAAGSRSAALH